MKIVTQTDYSKQIKCIKVNSREGLKQNKSPFGKLKSCDPQNG